MAIDLANHFIYLEPMILHSIFSIHMDIRMIQNQNMTILSRNSWIGLSILQMGLVNYRQNLMLLLSFICQFGNYIYEYLCNND
jgi:hypothetical protein